MSEIDPGHLNYFLSRETGLKFPLGNDVLESVKLSEKMIENIMIDLGGYLGILHSVEGEKYGLIDGEELGKGKLVGSHRSWYEFLVENFDSRLKQMREVLKQEEQSGEHITKLSPGNRKLMADLLSKGDKVRRVVEKHKDLIESALSGFLNGNIHMGSIIVNKGKFVGLGDFHQPLLGDPVDDLAYFSVMPQGEKYLPFVLEGWKDRIKESYFEEKLHLYRLLEAYRKIVRRYIKYRYLQDYPEPLTIAQKELAYYNKR